MIKKGILHGQSVEVITKPSPSARENFSLLHVLTLLILLIAIKSLIVLAIVPLLGELLPGAYQINRFPDGYNLIAQNILAGDGYRFYPETSETLLRLPGFVFVLVAVFYFFGESLQAVQLLNVLFSVTTAVLIYLIARQVLPEKLRHRGLFELLPSFMFLFHPGIILAESRGGTESFFTMLITLSVYLLITALRKPSKLRFLIFGIVFGLAFLTRGTVLLFPPVLASYFLIRYGLRSKMLLVHFPVMMIGMVLTVSPWIIRNYMLADQFILSGTIKGVAAYQGLYLNEHASSEKPVSKLLKEAVKEQKEIAKQLNLKHKEGFFQYFFTPRDEVVFYNYLFQNVKSRYMEEPRLLVESVGRNFVRFWIQGRSNKSTVLNTIIMVPLVLISIIGAYVALKKRLPIAPILLFVVAYILPHLPLIVLARYAIPLVPFLAILASISLIILLRSEKYESTRDYVKSI